MSTRIWCNSKNSKTKSWPSEKLQSVWIIFIHVANGWGNAPKMSIEPLLHKDQDKIHILGKRVTDVGSLIGHLERRKSYSVTIRGILLLMMRLKAAINANNTRKKQYYCSVPGLLWISYNEMSKVFTLL